MRTPKPLKIIEIDRDSIATDIGFEVGDRIISINGQWVRDALDFQFLEADEELIVEVFTKQDETVTVEIEKDADEPLGLHFEPIRFRKCGNKCLFCFVDQNPPGLRKSLYFKDEDYRLSFLYGNYVTLTNIRQSDLERIVRQRLSPIYVSVHTTDSKLRQRLLGCSKCDNIMASLNYLASFGIEIHTQIVLIPEINDKEVLVQTITDLSALYPQLASIALVPVGLTAHRERLPALNKVTPSYALSVIESIKPFQDAFHNQFGEALVYLADEWYLLSQTPLPMLEHYQNLPQLSNGVGLVRQFEHDWADGLRKRESLVPLPKKVTLITGEMAAPVLETMLKPFVERFLQVQSNVVSIPNRLFGKDITVAGLVTGRDIVKHLQVIGFEGKLLIPSIMLNEVNGRFLDDLTPKDIEVQLDAEIRIIDCDGRALLKVLSE